MVLNIVCTKEYTESDMNKILFYMLKDTLKSFFLFVKQLSASTSLLKGLITPAFKTAKLCGKLN